MNAVRQATKPSAEIGGRRDLFISTTVLAECLAQMPNVERRKAWASVVFLFSNVPSFHRLRFANHLETEGNIEDVVARSRCVSVYNGRSMS